MVGCAAVWPIAVRGQQPGLPVVGVLYSAPMDILHDETSAFREGLAEIGYTEGRSVAIEYRTAENHLERLQALRPVYSHRIARKAATRLMSPAKQASVFS